ncbi:hypothetical protein JVT61DRAFT_9760 [Boletus reticuloceps]|uniref:DUF6589 domain-containing protein n=1 Tax=Boletus reticuloceps TaxID=495285 RepID=A0A8I2YG13_9AGAM|nr:hypothetical protein JVT61DRAFT_9760 [Boletus reticuloceps]
MLPLHPILDALDSCQISAADFVVVLLTHPAYRSHPIADNLVANAEIVFKALMRHPTAHTKVMDQCFHIVEETYLEEIQHLASTDSGSHFGAASATIQQLEEFRVEETAHTMEIHAPRTWNMLGSLLRAKQWPGKLSESRSFESLDQDREDLWTDSAADALWNEVDEIDLEGVIDQLTGNSNQPSSVKERQTKRRSAIRAMKKTIICSILMQGVNRKSNALQSIIGFFLQSVHAPYNVINTLAHLGISISTDAINMALRSLSIESEHTLQTLGQSLIASYAYDNFDVDLKTHTPTVEKSNESLKHLTSGLLFPLAHGVTPDDLRCSEELWKKSLLNPDGERGQCRTWWDLVNLHKPEAAEAQPTTNPKPSRYHQFNAWMFLNDLCTYGPEYFRQFKPMITHPDPIEQMPLVKMPIFAARAMDINNSTVSGNIRAVVELLKQGGVHESAQMGLEEDTMDDQDSPDISQHVILVHGDLGTAERLYAAQLRRSIESTPWHRFQHVVFIPGLFHLKMACADVLWRCFIQPQTAREDETCLMNDVALLRPKETLTFTSKPGFRLYVQAKNPRLTSLDDFASTKPTLEKLQSMADEIAQQFVITHQIQRLCRKREESRDLQFENTLLLNKYLLLYEELSYAMNCGDIGRVETCIVEWIPILKAIGKHKYATHMLNFLLNVHFVYPPGLKRAVRYHLLVNPTGQSMKWRAVDWCVELNNLFIKVKNGGKGPNRTVDRIILESPLVQVYRNVQKMIQTNFDHAHLTAGHGAPSMTKTFSKLQEKLLLSSPHIVREGRKSQHVIEDLSDKGLAMLEKAVCAEMNERVNVPEESGIEESTRVEMEDVLVELL